VAPNPICSTMLSPLCKAESIEADAHFIRLHCGTLMASAKRLKMLIGLEGAQCFLREHLR